MSDNNKKSPQEVEGPPNKGAPTESATTKGEFTRQQIIDAALPLFSKQGYHGTSMRQIAGAAGIALGGIYNHFESKEAIFRAVSFAYHPIHTILPSLKARDGETVEAVVQDTADQMYATLSEREDFINLMFIEMVEFKGKHFPEIFAEMFPRALDFSTSLSKKRGSLRQDIPLSVITFTFIGIMFVFFFFSRMFGTLSNFGEPKSVLRQVVDIYLHGILSTESTPRTEA